MQSILVKSLWGTDLFQNGEAMPVVDGQIKFIQDT